MVAQGEWPMMRCDDVRQLPAEEESVVAQRGSSWQLADQLWPVRSPPELADQDVTVVLLLGGTSSTEEDAVGFDLSVGDHLHLPINVIMWKKVWLERSTHSSLARSRYVRLHV